MSEAFVAGALHWNPAGLSQIRKHEISAIYLELLTDTWYGSIGYAHRLKSGGKLTGKCRRRARTPIVTYGTPAINIVTQQLHLVRKIVHINSSSTGASSLSW